MEAILKKDKLGQWVAALQKRGEVFAPDFVEDAWEFTKVNSGADLELDHTNTVRPAKGFVFPQREVLYRFRLENGKAPELTNTEPKVEPAVVFGVRPCDGRAMVRNDRVFTCGFSDPYYQARRDQVVFVGPRLQRAALAKLLLRLGRRLASFRGRPRRSDDRTRWPLLRQGVDG